MLDRKGRHVYHSQTIRKEPAPMMEFDALTGKLNELDAEMRKVQAAGLENDENLDRLTRLTAEYRATDARLETIARANAASAPVEGAQVRKVESRHLADQLSEDGLVERMIRGEVVTVNRDVHTGSGGLDVVQPDVDPAIALRGRSGLTLLDLFPQRSTGSDTFRTYVQTGFTNAAAPTARVGGGTAGYVAAPKSDLQVVPKTFSVVRVAHHVRTDVDTLSDAGQLRALIEDELVYGLRESIQSQMFADADVAGGIASLVAGAGDAGKALRVPFATGATANDTALALILAIRSAKTAGRLAKLPGDFVALSPEQIEAIETYRTAQGNFLAGGPFAGGPGTIWGLRMVESDELNSGSKAIVGSTRGYVLLSRQSTELSVSQNVSDDFVKGATVLMATARLIGANVRPEAMVVVEETADGS